MSKKFALLLAMVFLSVQLLSLAHMAERGFFEHTHNGHSCDIYLSFDKVKLCATPDIILPLITLWVTALLVSFVSAIFTREFSHASAPRAPPAIFLS